MFNTRLLLFLIYSGLIFLIVGGVLYHYAHLIWRRIHWFLRILIFCSLFICFVPVAVLMVDCNVALSKEPAEAFLVPSWYAVFVGINLLSWIVLPVAQSFCEVGQFTAGKKLGAAIAENVKLYIAMGLVGAILLVWIAVQKGVHTFADLKAIGISASNAAGLLLAILLLGYGLVEFPRQYFRHANLDNLLLYFEFRAQELAEAAEDARLEWIDVLAQITDTERKLKGGNPLKVHIEQILAFVKKFERELKQSVATEHTGSSPAHSVAAEEMDLKYLVDLNRKVIKTVMDVIRTEAVWRQHRRRYFFLEDVRKASVAVATRRILHSLRKERQGRLGSLVDQLEWVYWTKMRKALLRLWGILLALLSLIVFWSEAMYPVSPKLSVLNHVVHLLSDSDKTLQVFILCFVSYVAWCCYWSLFRLKLFDVYSLVPGASSSAALCFTGYMLSRLILPMCFNFILIADMVVQDAPNSHVAFTRAFGNMDTVGLLGNWFNKWFMSGLIIFMATATLFHLYSRVVRMLSLRRFEGISRKEMEEGCEEVQTGKRLLQDARMADEARLRSDQRLLVEPEMQSSGRPNTAHNPYAQPPPHRVFEMRQVV
eukprot:TRINITY_DN14218_c0_g1_i1.p1 TRINITY_DN14218_c0_g1~~TRINITY_DN14218_c0_g1_i1.p1  ORF type:complete len:597 (-),score=124.75 TRINITY_DN14218_c0_g1_i1:62-1852(-)